MKTDHME